jgi:8-oxo-dGTP pyrophosphatase MutT (NUDIX family)
MSKTHPRYNDTGHSVMLTKPSKPTSLFCWDDSTAIARVVPDGPLPGELNGLALAPWQSVECEAPDLTVPPLAIVPGKAPAAGAVVVEPDGRVWVIHPSNAFGGYRATFPKGKQEPGLSLEQTAIKETFEETGLIITLTGWLVDVQRSASLTRYFLARRLGGTPAAMGWESQAVSLVPRDRLPEMLHHPNDHPLLEALHHIK